MESTTQYFSPGIGKERHVRAWLQENLLTHHRGLSSKEVILHVISREEIKAKNVDRLLEFFGPHIGIDALRRIRGKVHFAISGYDDTAEELYQIEEVLDYFKIVNYLFPAWLFAASTESPSLLAVLFISCNLFESGRTESRLVVKLGETCKDSFYAKSLPTMKLLNYITQTSTADEANQLEAVQLYLVNN
jgi:hypothetical protein